MAATSFQLDRTEPNNEVYFNGFQLGKVSTVSFIFYFSAKLYKNTPPSICTPLNKNDYCTKYADTCKLK